MSIMVSVRCSACNEPFEMKATMFRFRTSKGKNNFYCSKQCGKLWAKINLDGYAKLVEFSKSRKFSIEDFWPKVNIVYDKTSCWEWDGPSQAYGIFKYDGKQRPAHKFGWEKLHGKVPTNIVLCHTCDNGVCCRPSHLFLGTNEDNRLDMINKNRQAKGEALWHWAKLTEEQVREIKTLLLTNTAARQIAVQFNVSIWTIRNIKYGKTWTHVT